MTLKQAYASATETPIAMIEIIHSGLSGTFRFCEGYKDLEVETPETGAITCTALGLGLRWPPRNADGTQDLQFVLDNTNRNASDEIKNVISASRTTKESAVIRLRAFLPSDLTTVVEGPYDFIARGSQRSPDQVSITASFFRAGSLSWPFRTYNTTDFPGVKYA
jgi:hypothetical protein